LKGKRVIAHTKSRFHTHDQKTQQSWFGHKFQNKTENFHHNMIRGAKKEHWPVVIKTQKKHYLPTKNIKMRYNFQ